MEDEKKSQPEEQEEALRREMTVGKEAEKEEASEEGKKETEKEEAGEEGKKDSTSAATQTLLKKLEEADQQILQEVSDAEPLVFSVNLVTPSGSTVRLDHVSTSDTVLGLKQLIGDLPELACETCYRLDLVNGSEIVTLNDYSEITEFPALKEDCELRMVREIYDARKAKLHLKRFREVLANPPVPPPPAASLTETEEAADAEPESSSTSDLPLPPGSGERKKHKKGKKKNAKKAAADQELKRALEELQSLDIPVKVNLLKFYEHVNNAVGSSKEEGSASKSKEAEKDSAWLPQCLKSICFSGFNPPPGPRRLQGDLFYLEVTPLEGPVLHITACPQGFYVNRSKGETFSALPADQSFLSHSLLELLSTASPSFTSQYEKLLKEAEKIALEGSLPIEALLASGKNVGAKPQWNYPYKKSQKEPDHTFDKVRAEESLLYSYGMEEKGVVRDWNEEYQCCKELPSATLKERVARARVLTKIYAEFEDAARAGAVAIVQGHIPALNPMDPPKAHVYVFNSIFFSYAVDGRNVFSGMGGDEAARSSANHDLRGVMQVNLAGIPGLHTLLTAVVDYCGLRVVAQSIIPGILQGEAASTLVYGSVDNGNTLASDPKMHEMMCQLGKALGMVEREIKPLGKAQNEEEGEAETEGSADEKLGVSIGGGQASEDPQRICGPVDCKGIKGSDGRFYILDLVRITPRDYTYYDLAMKRSQVKEDDTEKKPEEEGESQDKKEKETAGLNFSAVDDPTVLLRPELVQLYLKWSQHRKRAAKEGKKGENGSASTEKALADAEESGSGNKEEEQTPSLEKQEKAEDKQDEALDATPLNVNVFMPYACSTDAEEAAQDIENAKEAAVYLQKVVIPSFLSDLVRGTVNVSDGLTLTEALHSVGINARYLGRLAALLTELEKELSPPQFLLELLETEMVARAAKRLLRDFLSEESARLAPGSIILSLLNSLLGSPAAEKTEPTGKTGTKNKQQKAKESGNSGASAPPSDVLNRTTLWGKVKQEVQSHFGYNLRLWGSTAGSDRCDALPLLRRFCLVTGVQVLAKEYDFTSSSPFSLEDVYDLLPVVKSSQPKQPLKDAAAILERARLYLAAGQAPKAYQLAQESALLLFQVTGPVHQELAYTSVLLAMAAYEAQDPLGAFSQQQRALSLFSQLDGLDHPHTAHAHATMALYCQAVGDGPLAIRHTRRAIYLLELVGGERGREVMVLYHKLGQLYHEMGLVNGALKSFGESLRRCTDDHLHIAAVLHSLALVYSSVGAYREAMKFEKKAFALFKELLGENDYRTKDCSLLLAVFTERAVEGAKLDKQQEAAAASDAAAADLVASELLRLEEEKAGKKKKKQKGKK